MRMNESWEKFARNVCDEVGAGAKWVLRQRYGGKSWLVFTFKAGEGDEEQEWESEWQIQPDRDVGEQTSGDFEGYDEMDTWEMVIDDIEDTKENWKEYVND